MIDSAFSGQGQICDLFIILNTGVHRGGRREEERGEHESLVHVENLSSAHRWAELNHSAAQNPFVAGLV